MKDDSVRPVVVASVIGVLAAPVEAAAVVHLERPDRSTHEIVELVSDFV